MKKPVRILKVLFSALIFLGLVQVMISNQLATAGEKLTQLDREIKALEEENGSLRKEIAVSSSLTTIAEKAEEDGFLKAESFLYLVEEPFALNSSR